MVFINFITLYAFLLSVSCESNAYAPRYLKNSNIIKNPNVILIIVDDLRPLISENVDLGNINKLAGRGVNFNLAFAQPCFQQSLCAPSRNSMLTGRRPDSLRLYDFYSYWRDTVGNFTTIPQFFKQYGYRTYSIGKIFHPGKSSNFTDDFPYSWSSIPYHPPTEQYKNAAVCKDNKTRKFQRNLICPVNVDEQPGKSLPDLQSLEYAIKMLKQQKIETSPFFMAVGFHKPHIPLKFPEKYLEKIPIKNVKTPQVPYIPPGLPVIAWHPWTDIRHRDDIHELNIPFPFGTIPKAWARKIKQSYIAAALYVDDLIGTLMRYVNTSNTIVVLTSDHGWSLGENDLWAKYSNFDVALKVPLIFNGPGLKHREVNVPVELVDLFPTIIDMALSKIIPKCNNKYHDSSLCLEGKSLVPFFKNVSKSIEEYVAISQYPRPSIYPQKNSDKPRLKDIKIMGYSIRTKTMRYTEWISFNNTSFQRDWNTIYGIELYNHTNDPYESKNLYKEPEYYDIVKYLSHRLKSKVESTSTNS